MTHQEWQSKFNNLIYNNERVPFSRSELDQLIDLELNQPEPPFGYSKSEPNLIMVRVLVTLRELLFRTRP